MREINSSNRRITRAKVKIRVRDGSTPLNLSFICFMLPTMMYRDVRLNGPIEPNHNLKET